MANNPSIYNGALNGATGGVHERWITATQSVDYTAIRNAIVEFAGVVDALIPADVTIGAPEGDLMQAITQGVLASRYIDVRNDFTHLAQAIVALWDALRGQQEVITTDVSSDNVIVDVDDIPVADSPFPPGDVDLTRVLIADGDFSGPGTGYPGYITRYAWVNAASTRIGTVFAGARVSAAPTVWSTEADVPPGNIFVFYQWGSGGGGASGSGSRGASGSFSLGGGGPGGGAALNVFTLTRADILAALPITFTTPLGGVGGASIVATSTATPSGNNGTNGAVNRIVGTGLDETSGGGLAGTAGALNSGGAAGSGGGKMGNGITFQIGGPPDDVSATVSSVAVNNLGGARSNNRTTTGSSGVSQYAIYGGSGGGSYTNGSVTIFGGRSKYGACGGGAGGRYTNVGGTVGLACEGGNHAINDTGNPGGGGGGTAGVTNGENGGNGADGHATEGGQGGGGGNGAVGATAPAATAGRGGDGGFPGGGGGGGGAAYSNGAANATSGRGGDGGDALTLLTIKL